MCITHTNVWKLQFYCVEIVKNIAFILRKKKVMETKL